jgi:lysozyme
MNKLTISTRGLDLVKHFESFFAEAYWDKTGKCWTIGYGHTGLQHKDGTVFKGRVITETEALRLLDYDMDQYEARVRALVKVPLKQWQFDALVSFDFNCDGLTVGPQNATPSTILRHLNAERFALASAEFPKWRKSGGVVLKGLVRRRNAERAMFDGEDWTRFKA